MDTNTQNILTNQDMPSNTQKQTIKVAVVLPLSGTAAATGKRLLRSLPVIENLIENFKYDKQFGSQFKFDLIIKDDACNVAKAEKIARDIVTTGDILFVIGHFCSAASLVAAPIYEKAGVIQITPFSTEPSLTEKGYRTLFRLAGRNDRYGEITADWLHEFRRLYKLATVYGDDIYGVSLVKNVVIGLELRSRKEQTEEDNYYKNSFNLKQYKNNTKELVDILIRDKIKLVYYGGYYTEFIPLIKEVKRRGEKIIFFGGDSLQNYDFWLQSEGAAEDVIFTLTKDITRDITQEELNQVKRTTDFNKAKKNLGLEEAIRKYGIESNRSIFARNSIYKDRARFIKTYFEKLNEFPDLYMSHVYATFQIIKDIAISQDLNETFKNLKLLDSKDKTRLAGYEIAEYMKDKGSNPSDEYVGFSTIIGAVNFSTAGDWNNAEYVIYHWINKPQDRNWLTEYETKKFIGANGDFTRLF
jgi:ABC-type branched-subunit amino acid transport system substrate-binding protein